MSQTPTSASKVGIVYSVGKRHVRMHIYADHDAQWPWIERTHVSPGCAIVYVSMDAHHSGHETFHAAIDDAVRAATGSGAVQHNDLSANCAVIDPETNLVENVIRADDSIDAIPGKILKNHPFVAMGHRYNPETGGFIVPASVLPAKPSIGRHEPVTVPETEI